MIEDDCDYCHCGWSHNQIHLICKTIQMNSIITRSEQKLRGTNHPFPAVSIIMPFETTLSLKHELQHKVKIAVDKLEKDLLASYPPDKAMPVILKLKNLPQKLNYYSHKEKYRHFYFTAGRANILPRY